MDKPKPLKVNQVDTSKIAFEGLKVRKSKSGPDVKICPVTYSKLPFFLRTPKMVLPFGVTSSGDFKKKEGEKEDGPEKFTLEFDMAESDEVNELTKLLNMVDDLCINYISKHSKEWFNGIENSPSEVKKHIYGSNGSMIKPSKEEGYNPRFSVQLPFIKGEPDFKVFDSKNNLIPFQKDENGKPFWSQKRMKAEAVLECVGIWLLNTGKAYCKFKVAQLRIEPPGVLDSCAFEDDETETTDNAEHVDDNENNVEEVTDQTEVLDIAEDSTENNGMESPVKEQTEPLIEDDDLGIDTEEPKETKTKPKAKKKTKN